MTEIQRDIKIYYRAAIEGDFGDIEIDGGDFDLEDGLENIVLISLFSDFRVNNNESETKETRGFWAEDLLGYNLGSKLWLLERRKINDRTLRAFEQYAKDCLKWTIAEGIVEKIVALAMQSSRVNGIDFYLVLYKPDETPEKFRYQIQWDRQLAKG